MTAYTVAVMVAVRTPGEMGTHRKQTFHYDTATPVLEVIRDLGRRGAVYREPDDLYGLADRILKASGQWVRGDRYNHDAGSWAQRVNQAAQLGQQDRINARRRARSTA